VKVRRASAPVALQLSHASLDFPVAGDGAPPCLNVRRASVPVALQVLSCHRQLISAIYIYLKDALNIG